MYPLMHAQADNGCSLHNPGAIRGHMAPSLPVSHTVWFQVNETCAKNQLSSDWDESCSRWRSRSEVIEGYIGCLKEVSRQSVQSFHLLSH